MNNKKLINRRIFLKSAAMSGALLPMIVPSRVFGKSAPSKLLNVGMIGCGGIANGHHYYGYMSAKNSCRITAVCDADTGRAKTFAQRVDAEYNDGSKCKIYPSYKELIADKSIDVVSIAAHDHTHVPLSIAAARAGKNIYCEKSLSINMDWSKHLRDVIKETGVVFQFGTHQRSMSTYKRAVELVRNGYIGNVKTVYAVPPDGRGDFDKLQALANTAPIPETLDFDMWQNVAPLKDYSSQRASALGGYHIDDYALGFISNWGIHCLDIMQWGLNMDSTTPVRVEGSGKVYLPESVNTAYAWDLEYTYANGIKGRYFPSHDIEKFFNKYSDMPRFKLRHGVVVFVGDEGWVAADRDGMECSEIKLRNIKFKPEEWQTGKKGMNHFDDFLNACKGVEKNVSPIDVAVHSDSLCFMADAVVKTNKSLDWDLNKEVALNSEQNRLMTHRQMRQKWREW